MGGHIDCYLDVSSFYSYLTLPYLLHNRALLSTHDVTISFHPVFLGGINVASGNKPPWTLPAKAAYGKYDMARAKLHYNMPDIAAPDFFPPLTILPLRALGYIKATYSPELFEKTFLALFTAMWTPPHSNITLPEPLTSTLSEIFPANDVATILTAANKPEWKGKLTATTKHVVEQGAFGAPWMWVRNGEGKEEGFFGSDRWAFMWRFLGLEWEDVKIVPKGQGKAKL